MNAQHGEENVQVKAHAYVHRRQKTTVCQKLPDVLAPKVSSYLLYVRSKQLKFNFTLQNMGAMDETPIWIDMAADSTVDFVGNKSLSRPLAMRNQE